MYWVGGLSRVEFTFWDWIVTRSGMASRLNTVDTVWMMDWGCCLREKRIRLGFDVAGPTGGG